jgi:hypothetical protein
MGEKVRQLQSRDIRRLWLHMNIAREQPLLHGGCRNVFGAVSQYARIRCLQLLVRFLIPRLYHHIALPIVGV